MKRVILFLLVFIVFFFLLIYFKDYIATFFIESSSQPVKVENPESLFPDNFK